MIGWFMNGESNEELHVGMDLHMQKDHIVAPIFKSYWVRASLLRNLST
jgi:hypothetical protein